MRGKLTTDSSVLALDIGSVRSFDSDGRMHVSKANISKATVNPYKGDEIPGYEQLGLEPTRVYQMLRDPKELKKAAATFNGVQLLKKHVPVDVDDHQMWDIVGTTGTDSAFDGTYLTNSLHVWTKEGIDFIESGDQRELSCGYHYVPVMTEGLFDGKHYDGVMTEIEGNHVALVEEGRAGHDVVVGDSAHIERDEDMKPTRLEYAVLMRTAAAVNPLLAFDAKVDYRPLTKGLTTKNFKQRKATIMDGVRKAIKGKTIAKDASIEHLAKMLDTFEQPPGNEKSWDESVSEPQHKAMEAAAHGKSNLDIPQSVGEEFSEADKGKKFGDMIRDWMSARDASKPFGEDDFAELEKMHGDCSMDEEAEEALDEESEEDKDEQERDKEDKGEFAGEDGVVEEGAEEAADRMSARDRKAAKDKAARDRKAKDRKDSAMDRSITQDQVNKMIKDAVGAERKAAREQTEARAFVRPYVGEISMAMDTAEKVLRAGAQMLQIENADSLHVDALKPLIQVFGKRRTEAQHSYEAPELALDSGDSTGAQSFEDFFGAGRIRSA